jgi:uncharacterized membrane protein
MGFASVLTVASAQRYPAYTAQLVREIPFAAFLLSEASARLRIDPVTLFLAAFIASAVLVARCRVHQREHTASQVLAGLSFGSVFALLWLWLAETSLAHAVYALALRVAPWARL